MKIFDRLIGLETEYAIRFRPWSSADRPSDYHLYTLLTAGLQSRLPTAAPGNPAEGKIGLFLANGGAVWFERARLFTQSGLVEGSTPECRGPRHLLICQRAQDRLLSETTQQTSAAGDFCLLKNCRDSRGQTYGAQENYEALLARGWRLTVWRLAWMVLYPLLLVYLVTVVILITVLVGAALGVNFLVAGLVYVLICLISRPAPAQRRAWRSRLFGAFWVTYRDIDAPWPSWLEGPVFRLGQLVLAPVFVIICGLLALTDLRQTQQRLLAFLASRAVLGGSGWLDAQGNFHLTEKAETRRCIWLEILADSSRPVFNLAHYCKMVFLGAPRLREILSPRQRLQISLGDSNLCEEAEYLRVATTALVLDAIEGGAIARPPLLRRPLRALHQISRDPTLRTAVTLRGGGRMTALEIQRWYLEACRRFVEQAADAPPEAREVLRRWGDVLDRLDTDRWSLVGRLDWVTKQYLLDRAGAGLSWAARKKIDLRYHELSPAGYFQRLQAAGQAAALVSEEEVEQAMRLPPPSSPALRRARYIREYSGRNTLLKVGWRFLEVIQDGTRTTIDLQEPLLWN
jgi:proteasome accessory factor A